MVQGTVRVLTVCMSIHRGDIHMQVLAAPLAKRFGAAG